MDPVRYRILGTTQALQADGTPVPVGGARLRALLTVLALRPGRTVPATTLVDEVWADDPPADAPAALQALVGRLRRALGPDAVASLHGGYRLAAAPDDIDLHRFERLADEGARALADGDPAKAADVLDDALALWQGPPLADLPDRTAEAGRWETRRLDAHRTRLTAALTLGRADSALPDLTALCDTHPLDEPLQSLRLRALRDTGRSAEALAAYEDVRTLLADRLGTTPGPALRTLHEELLAEPHKGRGELRDQPPPTRRGGTGRGGGGEKPNPNSHPARPPGNLRARLTSFVGRDTDIDTIRDDLTTTRLVTLLGPGGAGKTRLSQEAGEAVAEAMPDGVWLAELAPVDDPANVPEAVLTALGARETVLRGAGAEEMRVAADRQDDPLTRLAEHCAGRRMLLILDNCEHVVDAAAHLVDQLLQRCPTLTVLATSREPLGVPGELVRPVEPLTEPHALRLLADRGTAARPGFTVAADPEAAAEICRRLDGLPLAIELAAARLRMLTPRQIADRLDDRFRLLTSGSRTVLPRQQTLRAVVDWSWELLDEDERYVLRRLSVFAGGCDLAAAEAVCGPAALEALGSLVDKSLVVAAPSAGSGTGTGGGEMRYRLLETVVEYAGERLDETGTRPAAARAHLTHYRELVRATDPLLRGSGQRAAIELLELEYENIRTALRYAVAERDEQEALCLALSLCWYWQMRDLKTEARHWSAQVKELGPDPFTAPARPVPDLRGRAVDSPPPMSPAVLDEARRGVHLVHLACMDMELPAWQNSAAQEKLRVISETYRPGQPQTCRFPGFMWFYAVLLTGDMPRLRAILDSNIRTCRELGFTWELAQTLQARANILANRSDWAGDAITDADESLEIFDRLGDAWGAAEALSARGESLERQGEFVLAAADYERAIAYAERLGANAQLGVLGVRLGSAYIESGEAERGEKMLFDVLAAGRRAAAREAVPIARLFLAVRLGRSGRPAEAREQLTLLREDFHAAEFVLFAGFFLGVEGWLEAMDGCHEEALRIMRRALERSLDRLSLTVAPHMPAVHLVTAAISCAGVDGGARALDAARLLGAADALLPPNHFSSPMEVEARAEAEGVTRALLDDAAYARAYAEGGALTLEEAAALV
ncbi:AfsR/SARP family transcriptional regulator [Streptomyces europaeiscabiei]|uniref:AfsR/SARP family transcriptional regulator n=1 Tax=Streptomyces europaeiscabiei TaxID=146819 RepID=UPI0029AC0BBC|nr:BTAD domain-containing putative transcriptional regulator [Streptomyces europaeiscabiei]MDX3864864.1 BTAD domain-containing putative transcriptional regulator [Streptomyces europaeiscabiei]MDX3870956.1 BTAD domain-containing putative transcriptional regulator [Streptomyces europaeiscabiei]